MMTDTDLDNLYKANLPESHPAALRGVFDAGVAYGQGASSTPTGDVSQTVPDATAVQDTPVITTP
jgi:hypothetical protein